MHPPARQKHDIEPHLVRSSEAARFLGIDTDTLWALVEGGHLTVVYLPTGVQRRSPRFRIDDLKAAVESWAVHARNEPTKCESGSSNLR
ncbi:MAG TPA: hypothetical protein VHV82_06595 [Sporichthyaceae bacterium]|nr:hypothetical protein [Sporichthyaceae bacterium]